MASLSERIADAKARARGANQARPGISQSGHQVVETSGPPDVDYVGEERNVSSPSVKGANFRQPVETSGAPKGWQIPVIERSEQPASIPKMVESANPMQAQSFGVGLDELKRRNAEVSGLGADIKPFNPIGAPEPHDTRTGDVIKELQSVVPGAAPAESASTPVYSREEVNEAEEDDASLREAGKLLDLQIPKAARPTSMRAVGVPELAGEAYNAQSPNNLYDKARKTTDIYQQTTTDVNKYVSGESDFKPFPVPSGKAKVMNSTDQLDDMDTVSVKARPTSADRNAESLNKTIKGVTDGGNIWAKILSDPNLTIGSVMPGMDDIREVLRHDPKYLSSLVANASEDKEYVDLSTLNDEQLADLVNSRVVMVVMAKPPNNFTSDFMTVRLVLDPGHRRGTKLNNVSASMYKADYDGDDGNVSFIPPNRWAKRIYHPSEMLLNPHGDLSLDTDYLPLYTLITKPDWFEGDLKQYIMENVLQEHSGIRLDLIADAMIGLNETMMSNADVKVAWANLFSAIALSCNSISSRQGRNLKIDEVVNDILNLYIFKGRAALANVAEDRSGITFAQMTQDDQNVTLLLDEWVTGGIPKLNNYQEVRLAFNTFFGDVRGKNAPFRFTADMANANKFDPRLRIGDGTFVVDPDDKRQLMNFYDCLCARAVAIRMSKETQKSARNLESMADLRKKVIEKVGFPDDMVNGQPKYANRRAWLNKFAMTYQTYADAINEANRSFDQGFMLVDAPDIVRPLSGKENRYTYRNLADPIISVYQNYVGERIMPALFSSDSIVRDEDDNYALATNPREGSFRSPVERQVVAGVGKTSGNPYVYVNKLLKGQTIATIKADNRIMTSKLRGLLEYEFQASDGKTYKQDMMIGSDAGSKHAELSGLTEDQQADLLLLLAIADKRTSTASSFSTNVYGGIQFPSKLDRDGRGGRVKGVENSDLKKTRLDSALGKFMKLLDDLDTLDRQGTKLDSGTWACIGYNELDSLSKSERAEVQMAVKEMVQHASGLNMTLMASGYKGIGQHASANSGEGRSFLIGGKDARVSKFSKKINEAADMSVERYLKTGAEILAEASDAQERMKKLGKKRNAKENEALVKDLNRKISKYEACVSAHHCIMGGNSKKLASFLVVFSPANSRSSAVEYAINLARHEGIQVFDLADYGLDRIDDWKDDVIQAANDAKDGKLRTMRTSDQALFANDLVEAMISFGEDVFDHFGMNSLTNFVLTKYCQKMLEHKNDARIVGGIRLSMVFDAAMDLISERDYDIEAIGASKDYNAAAYMRAVNTKKMVIDEIRSRSQTWAGIIAELESEPGESFFSLAQEQLPFDRNIMQKRDVEGKKYDWLEYYDAYRFWTNTDSQFNAKDYTGLRDVMEDLDMPLDLKCWIISDIVKWHTNDGSYTYYEVPYGMEIGRSELFSPDGANKRPANKVANDMEGAVNRWSKRSLDNARAEVREARRAYGQKTNALKTTLKVLHENPQLLVGYDDIDYADALMAVKDKVSDQKSKQADHPATNNCYCSLVFQHLGTYINEYEMTDDLALGTLKSTKISMHDIVSVLYDPTLSIDVNFDDGSRGEINYKNLIGDDVFSEEAVWNFFENNPRIALAMRLHTCGAIADSDGTTYVGSNTSIKSTIYRCTQQYSKVEDVEGKMKFMFRDIPEFGGLVSLFLPGSSYTDANNRTVYVGSVTRNERYRAVLAERRILEIFYKHYCAAPGDSNYVTEKVLEELGLNEDVIYDNLASAWEKAAKDAEGLGEAERLVLEAAIEETRSQAEGIIDKVRETIGIMCQKASGANLATNVDISHTWSPDEKPIVGFRGSNGFLSNSYGHKITYKNRTYKCVEAAFQAQKTNDPNIQAKFTEYDGPTALKEGAKLEPIEGWSAREVEVMKDILKTKFSNKGLRDKLLSTGYSRIVESGDAGNTFWGYSLDRGYGENLLGELLMDLRKEIRDKEGDGGAARPQRFGIDKVSVASYYDCIQDLNSAKTQVAVGVEGNETYEYSIWVSLFNRDDRYGDFETLLSIGKVDQSFASCPVFCVNDDTLACTYIEVDEDGNVSNIDEIIAMKTGASQQLIVEVPEDFKIPDGTTRIRGRQLTSLSINSLDKRSMGAEEHTMKHAKNAGDDSHSIIKILSKFRPRGGMTQLESEVRERFHKDESKRPDNERLLDAKMMVANELYEANKSLEYTFTMANCMSIADYMVILADDGELYLRSLGMIARAIQSRYGFVLPSLDESARRDICQKVVNDTSEMCVGRYRTNLRGGLLLSDWKPRGAVSTSHTKRLNSSYSPRNYETLLNLLGNDRFADTKDVIESDKYFKWFDDVDSVLGRSRLTRGYNVVSAYGLGEQGKKFSEGVRRHRIRNYGPSNMLVIGDSMLERGQKIEDILQDADEHGMTVLVSVNHLNEIPDKYMPDAMQVSDIGDVLIPFFDMHLNGAESKPYTEDLISVYQAPHSAMSLFIEDPMNVMMNGDSSYLMTEYAARMIHNNESDTTRVDIESLFPNVRARAGAHADISYEIADAMDYARIVNGSDVTIDYGVPESDGRRYERRRRHVDAAIADYKKNFASVNDDGYVASDLKTGDIVCWAKAVIRNRVTGEVDVVLAPVIPFEMEGSTVDVPYRYSVAGISRDPGSTLVKVEWKNTSPITGGFFKMFTSLGFASKGMVCTDTGDLVSEDKAKLENGLPISFYGAEATTRNRAIGTEKRVKTMMTLMEVARQSGYNWAMYEDSFPDNDELRKRVRTGTMTKQEWNDLLQGGNMVMFTSDRLLNGWLNMECRKALTCGVNPTILLASKYYDESGNVIDDPHWKWEYNTMFEQSLAYEDMLLRFFNRMDPRLCPDGIDDDSTDHLFSLKRDMPNPWSERDKCPLAGGYDRGILQVYAPYPIPGTNDVVHQWANAYMGPHLLGKEHSGFTVPNAYSSTRYNDALGTASVADLDVDPVARKLQIMWANTGLTIPHTLTSTYLRRYDNAMLEYTNQDPNVATTDDKLIFEKFDDLMAYIDDAADINLDQFADVVFEVIKAYHYVDRDVNAEELSQGLITNAAMIRSKYGDDIPKKDIAYVMQRVSKMSNGL